MIPFSPSNLWKSELTPGVHRYFVDRNSPLSTSTDFYITIRVVFFVQKIVMHAVKKVYEYFFISSISIKKNGHT